MTKKNVQNGVHTVSASALTQRDADQFRAIVKRYGKANTSSKIVAQETLQSLGIHNKSGRLSSKYKTAKSG